MKRRNDLEIYDRHAADWWSGRSRFMRSLQALVAPRMRYFDQIVGAWQGRRVIDVGCGGGFMSVALAERGAQVRGVDPSEGSIRAARAHADGLGLPLEFQVGAGEALPMEDASADAVICVDVLEHVADLAQVVREFSRVLKPGGVLLFDTINRTWLARLLVVHVGEDLLRLLPRGTHDPRMFIKPAELRGLLGKSGFSNPSLVGLGPVAIDLHGSPVFRQLPTLQVMYMGSAVRGS
jgi:2-polyprenyl-6-hydroxyphenyl methylase/3-demethylubiquinone-9 3-methyltransferase